MEEPLSDDREGFICPFCLVSFASTQSLSTHFLLFHSEDGDSQPLINVDEGGPNSLLTKADHSFKSCLIPKPVPCHSCRDIAWHNGLMCQRCNKIVHERCVDNVVERCEGRIPSPEDVRRTSITVQQGNSRSEGSVSRRGPPKVKHIITRGRERYIDEEFDLDLTYITDRIIAMSIPATGLESTYRNSMKDVARMLHSKHQNHYMVFNVSDRSYDISKFNNQVLDFGWPDHLAPSLARLSSVCKSMKSWLDSDPRHVAVVHCKGGKGRTGCVIAAFMHYTELCHTAQEALDHFATKRFTGNKISGVTQPSQRRYVYYFSDLLKGKLDIHGPSLLLRHVIIHGVPDFDGKGGCRPFVKVYQNLKLMTTSGLYLCGQDNQRVKISFYGGCVVQGEVLLKCFHKKQTAGQEILFRVQFHTSAVVDHELVLNKEDLDAAYRDKRFPDSAKVEVIFSPYAETDGRIRTPQERPNIRNSLLDGHESRLFSNAKADSYEDLREIEGFVQSTEEDLIQLDSPVQSPKSVRHLPGSSNDSLYTSVDISAKKYSPKAERRPLPSPPPERENEITGKVAEYRKALEMSSGAKPEVKESDGPSQKYNYVDPEKLIALESTSEQGWYKVVHRENGEGSGDVSNDRASDYFNVDVVGEGQKFVSELSKQHNGGSGTGANRLSFFEISLPTASSNGPNQSVSQQLKDYANVKKEPVQYPQEDYVNNPLELLNAQDTPSDFPQQDYINSDMVDQSIESVPPPVPSSLPLPPSSDPIYCEPPDARDYINADSLELSSSHDETGDSEPARTPDKPHILTNFVSAVKSKLNIKEKGPSQIHSGSIVEEDRSKSLAFYKVAVPIGQVQQKKQEKGEDYFFVKDSWGSSEKPKEVNPPPEVKMKSSPNIPRKTYPPEHSTEPPKVVIPPLPPPNKPKSPMPAAKLSHPPDGKSPNHQAPPQRLPPSKPQPYRNKDKPTNPSSAVGGPNPSNSSAVGVSKPTPPTKPSMKEVKKQSLTRHLSAPVTQKPHVAISRKEVLARKSFWYKANSSRDAASELMMKSQPGYFIVRDSSTVTGGYALTIRLGEDAIRAKLKLPPDIEVTNDMCVKHFLIQPDAKGVRLQGWSEPPFNDLEDFIFHHCQERYCLPIVLVLPTADLDGSSSHPPSVMARVSKRVQPQEQAATDLIYLGMVDVSSPGSDSVITSVAEQLKSLSLTKANVVNFKASKEGLTVTDTVSGNFVKRFHPLHSISYCGLDPSDTRWEFDGLQFRGKSVSVKKARCFGFVWKPNERSGYMCGLFGELEPAQPVAAIVHFINKLLQTYKT